MVNPFKEVNWNPGPQERRKFALSLVIGFPCIAVVLLVLAAVAFAAVASSALRFLDPGGETLLALGADGAAAPTAPPLDASATGELARRADHVVERGAARIDALEVLGRRDPALAQHLEADPRLDRAARAERVAAREAAEHEYEPMGRRLRDQGYQPVSPSAARS